MKAATVAFILIASCMATMPLWYDPLIGFKDDYTPSEYLTDSLICEILALLLFAVARMSYLEDKEQARLEALNDLIEDKNWDAALSELEQGIPLKSLVFLKENYDLIPKPNRITNR